MSAKSDRRKISRHERRLSESLGGRKTFASGSGPDKGDGRVRQKYVVADGQLTTTVRFPLRIESKVTSKDQYRLTGVDWEKIRRAATRAGEHPLFHIQLSVPGVGAIQVAVISYNLATQLQLQIPRDDESYETVRSHTVKWDSFKPYLLKMAPGEDLVVVCDFPWVRQRLGET